ncbi:MAG: zinc ion binding [Piccolia ochrophora]|nr:MAG: zinc ion binding [Piccolia ochrophora]
MASSSSTSIVPDTMRAWHYSARGSPDTVLTLSATLPAPSSATLPEDHVVIKVAYTALNPLGYVIMGLLPPFLFKKPKIPEVDFSGEVVARGSAVRSELALGSHVFGLIKFEPGSSAGALAEYVAVPQDMVVPKPAKVRLEEAAGLGVTGCTAVELVKASGVGPGDAILINGGSGGVGIMIIQIAKAAVGPEGKVVATCSAANTALVTKLGADEVVDYRAHDPLHEYLATTYGERPFDAIIDNVGVQTLYDHSPDYLKEDGPFRCVGAMGATSSLGRALASFMSIGKNLYWPRILGGTPRQYIFLSVMPGRELLEQVKKRIDEGSLSTVVDSVWPMEDALKAYERIMSGRAKGKVVVHVLTEGEGEA